LARVFETSIVEHEAVSIAEVTTNMSCVSCHNALEKSPESSARRIAAGMETGKQWKQHQLLDAIEPNVPVDKVEMIANNQARMILRSD
jgi:cytochrome c551/c552